MKAQLDSLEMTARRATGDSYRPLTRLLMLALLCSTPMLGVWTVSAASSPADQNWPQWRGPLGTGVAPLGDPPAEWSETKNIKWKVKIPGDGSSTPIIWGDKVFVLTAINTGKKGEAKAADAAPGEPNPRLAGPPSTVAGQVQPAQGPAGGAEGAAQAGRARGAQGGGQSGEPGGRGGPGGFGPGTFLGQQMLAAGDNNKDQKLSREEFNSLADAWFDKLDPDKAGKLDQEKFAERFGSITGPPPEGAPGGRGGRGGGRSIAPGFFGAADVNKDSTLTREEFKSTFAKWFNEWDADKSGALGEEKLRAGLNEALPRPQFGGPGGRGGFGGGQKPTEVHQFVILCLDRQTGKVLWQQTAREELPHEGFKANDGTFASSSPITDGKHVFAYFGSRGLHCYDLAGKLQWSQDLGDMRIANTFGEGSSPALFGSTIVVNWDHEGDDFIAALDKATGQELWRQKRDERTTWATPLIVEHDGKPQVVTAATGKIRSYDLASGKLIWECGGLKANVIPTPVAGQGMVYAMSGFQGYALQAIRLGRTGDLTGTDAIAWNLSRSTPYVPSPLLYGEKLYFLASNNGTLSCFDALTGKPFYTEEQLQELPGRNVIYASPVGAAGKVFLVGRNGVALVIKNSDKLEVLATNRLNDKIDASPAIVGKELFLRGHENLYCIAEK